MIATTQMVSAADATRTYEAVTIAALVLALIIASASVSWVLTQHRRVVTLRRERDAARAERDTARDRLAVLGVTAQMPLVATPEAARRGAIISHALALPLIRLRPGRQAVRREAR